MSKEVSVVVDEKKGTMTITLPLEPKKSASGKSTVIASTRGNSEPYVAHLPHGTKLGHLRST